MNYRLLFSGRDCVPTETKKHVNFDKKRILRHRFNSGHLHHKYTPMFQDGELASKADCAEFDSLGVCHFLKNIFKPKAS